MFDVTTKYVKINDERKKVFMIKGDESYIKPTDTAISISGTIAKTEVKGFKIPSIVVDVYRNTGSSTVVLYDGEEIIKTGAIANGSHQVIFSNVYLAYGVDHDLYAVFVGNDSCYESKSKKIHLNETLPPSLKTTITFTSPTTQIAEGSNLTLNMTAKTNNVNVPNGTTISIYDGDTLKGTTTTSNGTASYTVTGLSRGKHTITARIEQTSSINATSTSYNVSVGYNIAFEVVPNVWVKGVANTVKFRVKNYLGNPMTSGNVTFNGVSGALNSSGVTVIQTTINTQGTYNATYGGSTSSTYCKVYAPSSITMSPSSTIIANGHQLSIPIQVTATGDSRGMPVNVSHSGTSSIVYLDANNNATYTYNGGARGENTQITASIGTVSTTVNVNDYGVYWNPSQKYNLDIVGQYSEQSSGILLTFAPRGVIMFNNTSSYNTIEFEVVSVMNMNNVTHHYRVGDSIYDKSVEIKKGTKLKLVWTADGILLYVNGVYHSTYPLDNVSSHSNWMIKSNDANNVRTFSIKNIKIY